MTNERENDLIKRYENGEDMTRDEVAELARVLGCSRIFTEWEADQKAEAEHQKFLASLNE